MASILLVGKGAPERGGIPTFLQQLLDRDWGHHRVRLLNLTHPGEREGGKVTAGNIARTITDALAVGRARDVDIVHIHTALAPLSTLVRASALCLAGRLTGRRVLLHAHGGRLVGWADSPRRRKMLAAAVRPAHHIVVVSEGLLTTMREAHVSPPVEHVGNGVDTTRFHPLRLENVGEGESSEDPIVLYVGHLSRRKGVVDLLEASRRLESDGIPHRLVLAGGVPDEGDGDATAIELARTGSTSFEGAVEPADMPALYRRAAVFCLPSWWEATPLSVLEAMASGLPVVASRVGDVESMVGDAGWTVPPKEPGELAAALGAALSDTDERRRRGRVARERAETVHDLTTTHRMLATIYDQMVGNDKPEPALEGT